MTPQEIFDTVAIGLRKQGQPAVSERGGCLYQADNGNRCAAGLLFNEVELGAALSCGGGIDSVLCDTDTPFRGFIYKNEELIADLQRAHDAHASTYVSGKPPRPNQPEVWMKNWRIAMLNIANEWNLDPSALDQPLET